MKKKSRKKPRRKVDPKTYDWSMSTRELAAKHKVSRAYVCLHRLRLAPHTIQKPNSKKIDWKGVDWQKTTCQLKKSLGCAHSTIQKMRAIHAPGTPGPEILRQCKLEGYQRRNQKYVDARLNSPWAKTDWSLTTAEIMRQTGATRRAVTHHRKKHAPETIKKRSPSHAEACAN